MIKGIAVACALAAAALGAAACSSGGSSGSSSTGGSGSASANTPGSRGSLGAVLLGDGVRVTCKVTDGGINAAMDIGVTASQAVNVAEVIFHDADGNGNTPVTLNVALGAGQSYHTSFPAAALDVSSCVAYTWLSPDGMQHP